MFRALILISSLFGLYTDGFKTVWSNAIDFSLNHFTDRDHVQNVQSQVRSVVGCHIVIDSHLVQRINIADLDQGLEELSRVFSLANDMTVQRLMVWVFGPERFHDENLG
ncbi:hypothetical protein WICPIJ_006542 [Wickerhamomyces pijperi]|uniref:Uncharacterized protein n=1 Tax=Wickerhamomyces pijperi TaxID=599730 RepID=A0A9P8Q3L7_WICPI|nr:hypothetical protein WICPIJ_006542 [Wickerhamomyces pijperi]